MFSQKLLLMLSEGSFFGEQAILNSAGESDARIRTVKAVTDCELCFINRCANWQGGCVSCCATYRTDIWDNCSLLIVWIT